MQYYREYVYLTLAFEGTSPDEINCLHFKIRSALPTYATLRMSQNYQEVPELREFFLSNARKTGKKLGSGAFGIVEELAVGGTTCAGKMLHSILLNEGADRIMERFVTECRLMSRVRHNFTNT